MLTPEEATPKALALLTLAHELYAAIDSNERPPFAQLNEDEVAAVLADDDGEIDWKAIAVALAMLGHVLLDTVPQVLYAAVEETIGGLIAKHFNASADEFTVTIKERLTGTDLLRLLSLRAMQIESGEMP